MKTLSAENKNAAREFMAAHARPLDWARYQFHFAGSGAQRVLDELSRFQNADGGFGHGLEADLRLPDSSVVATTLALQILREVDAPANHPLVTGAMKYLLQRFDPAAMVWPIVPPNTDDAPHAPWWDYSESVVSDWNGFLGNPRPEILGYFYDYSPNGLPVWVREELTRAVIDYLDEHVDNVSMFALLCYDRLVKTEALPESVRESLLKKLFPLAERLVEKEPDKWREYGLEPIEIVGGPDSPFAHLFPEIVEQNLDFEIERQAEDGGWHPSWRWYGDVYPDDWPIAERDAAGILTLRALRILRNFGRIESLECPK